MKRRKMTYSATRPKNIMYEECPKREQSRGQGRAHWGHLDSHKEQQEASTLTKARYSVEEQYSCLNYEGRKSRGINNRKEEGEEGGKAEGEGDLSLYALENSNQHERMLGLQ